MYRRNSIALLACSVVLPTNATASAWPQAAGSVRLSAAWSTLISDRQFADGDARGLIGPRCPTPISAGQRGPYSCVTGGRFTAHQTTFSGAIGLTKAVSIDVALPTVVASSFQDDNGRSQAWGVGDVRVGTRVGNSWGDWALSGSIEVQAPTGPRNFQDREVPIGQGQWDITARALLGRSLWPHGWVELHNGFRLRMTNRETGINPGEEWIGQFGGGWTPMANAGILTNVQWIVATEDANAFALRFPGRKLLQATTGVFFRSGRWWADAGVAVPLAGQSWSAGPVWQGSLAFTAGRRPQP